MTDFDTGIFIKKYGNIQPTRLTGGFTNDAYLLKGTDPLLVAKVAQRSNQDLLNEMHVLRFFNESAIAPKMVETFSENHTEILVSTFHPGTNGQSILDTGDLHRSEKLFQEMGHILARHIHPHAYDGNRRNLRLGSLPQPTANSNFVPKELMAESQSILSGITLHPAEWVLTHGDFGSHNILLDDSGKLIVIDWEWSEWFHPLVDLAWTCWNTKLHYPAMADRLNQAFLEAYQSRKPIDYTPEQMKAYSLYKLHHILLKVSNADPEVQKKWIQRLKWTLETDIL